MRRLPGNRPAGFTLIELMIVVTVIGILAAIAVPKFAELLRKSSEGKTKGNLGALRSALSIYYADLEGLYPTDLESLTLGGKYVTAIPAVFTPNYHGSNNDVRANSGGMALGCAGPYTTDTGQWFYWNDDGTLCGGVAPPGGQPARYKGEVWIGCSHTDTKGTMWTIY